MEEVGRHAVAQLWNWVKCGSFALLSRGSQGDEQQGDGCKSEHIVHGTSEGQSSILTQPARRMGSAPFTPRTGIACSRPQADLTGVCLNPLQDAHGFLR